ncbi:MAG: ribosome-associated translation inhibitor RaiA [Spirochaetota bacterium]
MHVNIQGRHVKVGRGLREHIAKRMEKLKFYSKKIIDAHVLLMKVKFDHTAEVTVLLNGKFFRFAETASTFHEAIDLVFVKIDRKLRSTKAIIKHHKHDAGLKNAIARAEPVEETIHIDYAPFSDKPMDEVEAVLEFSLERDPVSGYFPVVKNRDMMNVQVSRIPVFLFRNGKDIVEYRYQPGNIVTTVLGFDGWYERIVAVSGGSSVNYAKKKRAVVPECNVATASRTVAAGGSKRFLVFRNSVTGSIEAVCRDGKKIVIISEGR